VVLNLRPTEVKAASEEMLVPSKSGVKDELSDE
jgi:hypothetical protein